VRNNFVLRGPVEQKEGEGTSQNTEKPKTSPSYELWLMIRIKPTVVKNSSPPEMDGVALKNSSSNTALADLVSSSYGGIDLLSELCKSYHKDPLFESILKKPSEYRNFKVENGLVYLKEKGSRLLCIPKVLIDGHSDREIVISEAHSLLAHLGASKMLDYLQDQCWWKDMVPDTKSYCETCMTCKRNQPSNQKPYGLLNPLPVPGNPWESIGMDLVGPVPESRSKESTYDSITVVICLMAMVNLIPSRINYNARQLAELMFEKGYKHHGLPKNIVSDRDVPFTSTFWGRLHNLLGTKGEMSSAYHSKMDGSTERANRTVMQMLKQCINMEQPERHTIHPDSSKPAAFQTTYHPNIHRISDILLIITDIFALPVQHHTYPTAAIYACLTHEGAIRNDPVGMKDQPCPIGFDTLARVYNAEARGSQRFAYYAPHPPSNPAITHGDRIQPDG